MFTGYPNAYGRIDLLDYNVGIAYIGGAVELPEEDYVQLFAVTLKGCYLTLASDEAK